jgi:hypothetical protein
MAILDGSFVQHSGHYLEAPPKLTASTHSPPRAALTGQNPAKRLMQNLCGSYAKHTADFPSWVGVNPEIRQG